MKTILTPNDVKKYAVVDDSYRIKGLCDRLLIYEQTAFKDCLGLVFYDLLLNDISTIPDNVLEYDDEATYSIDDFVVYNYENYKSIADSNISVPSDTSKWSKVPKFKTACYDELYDKYLKIYLANTVVHNDIVFNTAQAGNKGLMTYDSDKSGQKSVDLELLYQWRRDAKSLALNTLELIKVFIQKQIDDKVENCDFSSVEFIQDCEGECLTDTVDRIAW